MEMETVGQAERRPAATRAHIRWLIRRDMPEVLEIERSLPASWGEPEYLDLLRQRDVIGMVAEAGDLGGRVVGVFVYRLLCGLFFALLFQLRGFAVAVYTHALYDIYVLMVRG